MDNNFDLVISIVNRGHSDLVVEASREAGANGGTIIYGRGTGVHERDSFMGVSIQPEKEIIMTLTSSETRNKIMETISEKAELDSEGMGICFSLPVSKVRGISSKSKTDNLKQEKTAQNVEVKASKDNK